MNDMTFQENQENAQTGVWLPDASTTEEPSAVMADMGEPAEEEAAGDVSGVIEESFAVLEEPAVEPVKQTPASQAALLEAILYLEGNPMDESGLVRISELSHETVRVALQTLAQKYEREDSGVELSRIGGSIMLAPKKEHRERLRERYGKKNEAKLSRAAMETLSIIAYSQPITRSEIEAIRGVQADNMIRLLLEKELIHEVGKKDVPGKPTLFGTTKEFLKLFRIASIADLPKLNKSEVERFELEG
jgi:segregation and condensation protein B